MPRAKEIIKKPIFKLGFLFLFLILSFGFLRHNFSARASDEQLKLYPQSFAVESNAGDLNLPELEHGSLWQKPENILTQEADQSADLSAFTASNSAELIFGQGTLPAGSIIDQEKNSTSSPADNPVDQTVPAALPADNNSDLPAAGGNSASDSPDLVPVTPDNPADNPSSDSSAPANPSDNPAPAAPDEIIIENHLPEAGPAAPDIFSNQPVDNPAAVPVDNPAPSAPADGGGTDNPAPAPTGGDQGSGDSAPVSFLDNLKITAQAWGQFWRNLATAPRALAENSGDASSSAPANPAAVSPVELKDSLILSDFTVDSYAPDNQITNVQLRLSLAAVSTFTFDHLLVEYSTGGDWQTAGDLFLRGSAANAANGGYFLYALPIFGSWDDINNLRVRISYQNSEISADALQTKAAKIYLDAAWLEVDYNQGAAKAQLDNQDLTGVPGTEEHFFNPDGLVTDGQQIDFNYGDATDSESLIIKTDRQSYTGLTGSPVYFSVTNRGSQAENFGLQTYFPAQDGDMTGLEKLSRQTVAKKNSLVGDRIYYCVPGWQLSSSSADYVCPGKNKIRPCDSISADQKKCEDRQAVIATSTVIAKVDQWQAAPVLAGLLPDKRNFVQKLFGLGPHHKDVPADFKPKESSDAGKFSIQPGETEYFKMNISFPLGSSGEFYLETVGDKSGYGLLDPWWNASWGYQVPVTVTYGGTNIFTNFQVSVTIDTATLITAGKMKSDCSDIAFADSNRYNDASELYYFIEPGTCNKSYTKVWVKIPSLSGTKTIYLYYGNSSATAYSSGANTFDYFNDFESGAGFNAGTLNPTQTAKAAKAGSYGLHGSSTPSGNKLETISGSASGRNEIFESWIKGESSSSVSSLAGIVVGHPNGNTASGYEAVIDTRGSPARYLAIKKDYGALPLVSASSSAVSNNTWYFLQFSWRSTNVLWASLYAGATTTSPILACSSTDATYTNGEYGVGAYQIGDWDNFRLRKYASSSVTAALGSETVISHHVPANPSSLQQYAQSTSTTIANGTWVTNNTVNLQATSSDKDASPFVVYYQLIPSGSSYTTATSAPAKFCDNNYSYSSCSNKIWANATTTSGWAASSSSYKYRQPIVVQSGQIAGALTNFPIYLDMARLGTANTFWSRTKRNSDGGDILITNSTGTRLPVEVVAISTSSKTGEVYFRADAISSSSNITFYLYYGSSTAAQPAANATYGSQGVWSNNYLSVYHFNNSNFNDSVGNFNGTNAGTAATSSKFGGANGARSFDGATTGISLGNMTALTTMTLEAWIDPRGAEPQYAKILGKTMTTHVAPYTIYDLTYNGGTPQLLTTEIDVAGTQYTSAGTSGIIPSAFNYVASTYDGRNLRFYYNGAAQGTPTAIVGTLATDADPTQIGRSWYGGNTISEWFNGAIDEVRITTVARSAKWLATEYHNQNSPATFYSTSSTENFYLTDADKAVMISGVPDSATGYKWQSLACDSLGACSNWAVFNSSLPNFMVDATAPTFSNTLGFLASTTNSIKLSFPTAATEINFSQYKLYYRLGSTTPIHETDSLWSSSSDGNLGSRTFNGKSSTTIAGLATNTVYSFSLWAYDLAGNKSSSSLNWERTDRLPTVTIAAATERGDGTGAVNLSFTADDPDKEDGLTAQADYYLDANCRTTKYKSTVDETDANTTATHGDPKVSNSNSDQIGNGSGYITTSAGANTVSTLWLSKTDQATATGTLCVKVTINDNRGGNSNFATTSVYIDNVAPTQLGSLTYSKKTGSTVTLSFGAAAHDNNFRQYKIFYKAGPSGVRETDTSFSSTSDVNLWSNNYGSAATTTITGLSGATQYVFNIWAYDQYGNKASGSSEVIVTTKHTPSIPASLAQYKSDGATSIGNNTWLGTNEVNLYATSTDPDASSVTVYYQLATSSGVYLTATTTPVNPCPSGTAYSSCLSRVWSSSKSIKADLKTIADGNYKWQAMACDVNGCSKTWGQFNASVPNFKIDTSAPTPPGTLVFNTKGLTNVKLNFGAPSVDPNFTQYRIFYKQGTSNVKQTDSLFSSSSDGNLGNISFNGKSSTTISGLTTGVTYVFNIFAYDVFGNVSSATTEVLVSLSNYPSLPFALTQYSQSTSTVLSNGAWTTLSTVNLKGTSSSANPFTMYYELLSNANTFTVATSEPAISCLTGTTFGSCTGKIWSNYGVTAGWYNTGYHYRTKITVNSSQVKGSITNFPVYLDLARLGTGNVFWSRTRRNNSGGDLLITNEAGTRLPLEVLSVSTTSYTGEVYFKADTLSSTTNTNFYLYYGSSTATQVASTTATYGSQNVWSNGYKGVWHLNESSGVVKDSTSYYNRSNTVEGAPTYAQAGKLGKSAYFNGTSAFFIPENTSLQPSAKITFSLWFNQNATQNAWAKPLWYGDNSATPYGVYGFEYETVNALRAKVTGAGAEHYPTSYPTVNTTWTYMTGVYSGASMIEYANGTQYSSSTWANGVIGAYDATYGLGIGDKVQTAQGFGGYIDEVRIASSSRSNGWVKTEYNNQSSPSTFFSTSSEQYYLSPTSKAVKITSIDDGHYKWHALACSSGSCSPWAPYNLTTPNFHIDTIAPTAPGSLVLVSRKTSSITLGFGSPSIEANFKQYKIFYKQGSSGVKETDTLFSSSSDSSLGFLNYNGVPSITINGLIANTQYVFNIWAYDQVGNKSSSTSVTFQTANSLTETYYYSSGATEGWINSPYAWDNSNNTYAYRSLPGNSADDSANYLQGTANNTATTTKSILGVELGLEGYSLDPSRINYKIVPLFQGLNAGNTHTLAGSLFGKTDSDTTNYNDITSDPNAPAHWTWDDIVNLDAKVFAANASSTAVNAYVDQIRLRVTVDSYPDNAKNLNQYKSDKVTAIANSAYLNARNIVLYGRATDPDTTESLSVYYEFIPTAQSFTAAATKPAGACVSGADYTGCSSKIWVASYSGTPGDFSVTPYIGTSSLTNISDGTYKWQALICDSSDICSAWTNFNAATPNLTVDNTAPGTPGNLTLNSKTSGSITINFGGASSDTNFSRYRIFYKKGSSSPVTEADSEQSDTNLNALNFNGAATTTVAGLAKSTWYTFNIWAYDLAGNKASATFSMSVKTTSGYLLTQTSYIMENDDGANPFLNTDPNLAGVALANVEKGQRLNARVQLQNTGADQTYNKRFKLQFENNSDSPGIWTDVGGNTAISYSYGLSGANGDPLTARKAAVNGNTWSNGFYQENTDLTNMYNLTVNHYTEFVFALQTVNATVGKTYRLRLIDGTGSSTFDTYTVYPTLSLVANDAKRYSKDALGSLPVSSADLTYFLDNPGYTAVATDDSNYDPITSAAGQYPIYNFDTRDGNASYALNISWNGQSSVAPTSNFVNLQVYRFGSVNAWTSLASNSAAALNTDFSLTGLIDYHISDYLSGGYVYWRVYQAPGAETFRSDYLSFTTSTPTAYVTGRHYRWRADDAALGTWREAQDTPDPTLGTAIAKNANLRLRLSFTDTKAGSATNYGFGLQYATTTTNCSSGALSSWYQVRSTATSTYQFQIALSPQYADASTTGALLSTDGFSFTSGRMVNSPSATSAAITLAQDNDTEVEFAIKATANAKAGQTYCFRGTKNNVALNAYDRYAELTVAGTTNTPPSFTAVPSDGGSATNTPTVYGQNVNFSATATDPQTNQYYLAICQTNSVTAGNGGAPTCPGGSWCISSRASSSAAASCTANTNHLFSEYYNWYGFACDYRYGAGIAQCSPVSQGQAGSDNASTFRVNHPPVFSAVATLNDYRDPGSVINIQATTADTDTNSTWSYYVCSTNGATAAGCNGGRANTYCSSTVTTTVNPICLDQTTIPFPNGTYTYYAFVYDNFSLAATTSPFTSNFHINNVAPSLGSLSLNGNADITLNIKGAADKQVQLLNTSVTDLNGCQTLVSATGVVYRTGLGYVCGANDNNCYQLTTSDCVKTDCAGAADAIATYTCAANLKYFAEPTDNSTNNPWSADTWTGRLQVYDGSNYAATTSPNIEVNTNLALNVPEKKIDFGQLTMNTDTGTNDQKVTVVNFGNSPINSNVAGTDLTGQIASTLSSTYIHWDLAQNFSYPTGNTLKNGGEVVSVNLAKPTSLATSSNPIYWGIGIPATSTHTYFHGSSTFSAVLNGSGW